MIGRLHAESLVADPSRVAAQLFIPGEGVASTHSRAAEIVARVMALPPARIGELAQQLTARFGDRHRDLTALLITHADAVASRVRTTMPLTPTQQIVLGATFTSEYAVEGAALCNPSAVAHPDQSGLPQGALRIAVALREIGEGHISSIGFAEAVIGPGRTWTFLDRGRPLARATITPGTWTSEHFRRTLEHEQHLNDLASAMLGDLPERFTAADIAAALAGLPEQLLLHRDTRADADALRDVAASAYVAEYEADSLLSQRLLFPAAAEEDHGMEDARFVRWTAVDGSVEYRATYTAYDGRDIAPRLITTPDLRRFEIHRLSGGASRNKGMALFPRRVGGEHLALARIDGETTSLARSVDGLVWDYAGPVHRPVSEWELIQTGNCGSPIETDRGWLVIMHGVGPMRTYSMGALLLDLERPGTVLARTTTPFLEPLAPMRDGYVPNVVYSCGALLHDGTVWIPIGIGDERIGVYSVRVDDLLDSMTPASDPDR